ncbi:MAG: hypothetical protein DRN90_05235 [Thermoproteota archaeon]|nr:MAG: hypothetical protein DRN90_05235 [Candidatus Korarchaeota archaeon]
MEGDWPKIDTKKGIFATIQLILLAEALRRLIKKVEKEEFDRAFLSDAVFVIGMLILLVGTLKPSLFEDISKALKKALSEGEES